MEKAIFVDRDGVINEMVYYTDHGFVDSPIKPSQVKIIKKVPEAIHILNSLGFKIIIISNQPGMAKKQLTEYTFELIRKKIHSLIHKGNGIIDDEFYCFHHPNAKIKKYKKICNCRKPNIGLINRAVNKYDVDLRKSFFIGDGIVDMLAAKKVNCKSIFVGNINSTVLSIFKDKDLSPDFVVKDLFDAVKIIKNQC